MSSSSVPPRLQTSLQQPWFAMISRTRRMTVSLAVAGFVFLSGGVLDWFVIHQYLPRVSLMLAGAALALLVGVLVFQILTAIQKRYQKMLDRFLRIAVLNDHIRNALQVIAYHNEPDRSERAIQQVSSEIVRIETALRGVSAALNDVENSPPPAVVPDERRFGS